MMFRNRLLLFLDKAQSELSPGPMQKEAQTLHESLRKSEQARREERELFARHNPQAPNPREDPEIARILKTGAERISAFAAEIYIDAEHPAMIPYAGETIRVCMSEALQRAVTQLQIFKGKVSAP